jgi:hypothetical protein
MSLLSLGQERGGLMGCLEGLTIVDNNGSVGLLEGLFAAFDLGLNVLLEAGLLHGVDVGGRIRLSVRHLDVRIGGWLVDGGGRHGCDAKSRE